MRSWLTRKKPPYVRSGKGILTEQEIDLTVKETLERGANAGQVCVFRYKGTLLRKNTPAPAAAVVPRDKGGSR